MQIRIDTRIYLALTFLVTLSLSFFVFFINRYLSQTTYVRLSNKNSNAAETSMVLYVSQSGSDTNIGTITYPLQHITTAILKASPGGLIFVRAGIYDEVIGVVPKQLTIQPFSNEEVWVSSQNGKLIKL